MNPESQIPSPSLSANQNRPTHLAFPFYIASSSLWIAGLSLQGLFVNWTFLGVLKESVGTFGAIRSVMSSIPLVFLLIGGIVADRVNSRLLLVLLTAVAACIPLFLMGFVSDLKVWHVATFGIAIALLNALGDPARQAAINRVTRTDIQRSVVIVFIVPSLLSGVLYSLFGRLEAVGLEWILLLMSAIFALSVATLFGLPQLPPVPRARLQLLSGFKAILKLPLIRDVIAMNFASSLFNAGGYVVAVPIIAVQVYEGNAAFLSMVSLVFLIASTSSNFLLLVFMPIRRPGLVFAALQLTRALILIWLLFKPSEILFLMLMGAWGLNMGLTSTLMRSMVQELAPTIHRAQILSVLLLSFMLSSPISSLVISQLMEATSPLTGLVPGIFLSILIFVWGYRFSGVWNYRSPSVDDHQSVFKRLISRATR